MDRCEGPITALREWAIKDSFPSPELNSLGFEPQFDGNRHEVARSGSASSIGAWPRRPSGYRCGRCAEIPRSRVPSAPGAAGALRSLPLPGRDTRSSARKRRSGRLRHRPCQPVSESRWPHSIFYLSALRALPRRTRRSAAVAEVARLSMTAPRCAPRAADAASGPRNARGRRGPTRPATGIDGARPVIPTPRDPSAVTPHNQPPVHTGREIFFLPVYEFASRSPWLRGRQGERRDRVEFRGASGAGDLIVDRLSASPAAG
jgi:hypothetical protein